MGRKAIERGDLLGAVLLGLLAVCWFVCGIHFETNDDTGILMFVAGAKTGMPTAETVFCNILWGGLISSLYKICEGVSWYAGIYMLLVWGVLTILLLCCGRTFTKASRYDCNHVLLEVGMGNLAVGGAVFCILFFSVFFYYAVMFQFTTIAAMCGLGALLLMFLCPKGNRYSYIAFFVLLFFADTIRPQVGYLAAAAFVVMLIDLYILEYAFDKVYVVIATGMQVFTYVINAAYEHMAGWQAFRAYHVARWVWKDYPHPSFEAAPDLYMSVGWTDKLYQLVDCWFFMDSCVNTEAFERLNSAIGATKIFSFGLFKSFVLTPQLRMTFCLLGIVVVSLIVLYCRKKYKCLTVLLISASVTIIFMGYFIYTGRLPYRVSFSIIILFMVPAIMLLLREADVGSVDKRYKIIVCVVGVMVAVYSCVGSYGLAKITYAGSQDVRRTNGVKTKQLVEQYAVAHQGNIYVYDYSLTFCGSPFANYRNGKPYNLMFWGGSGMYSPPYYDQLAANGLKNFYSDQFFEDNVYFISAKEPNLKLINYLKEKFSDSVKVETVFAGEGFIVYRFIR